MNHGRFKVSDPRDRAYSALGLATDLTSDAIVPDYNKSVAAVYMEMAQFLIRNALEGHKLDIFGYIDHSARDLRKEIEPTNSWHAGLRKTWNGTLLRHRATNSALKA